MTFKHFEQLSNREWIAVVDDIDGVDGEYRINQESLEMRISNLSSSPKKYPMDAEMAILAELKRRNHRYIQVGDKVKITKENNWVPVGAVGSVTQLHDNKYWVKFSDKQNIIGMRFLSNEFEKIEGQLVVEEKWIPLNEEELRRRKHEAMAKMFGFF